MDRETLVIAPVRPAAEVNPAGRDVVLTVPILDGEAYLGESTVTLGTDGSASLLATRLLALLESRIRDELHRTLRTRLAQEGRLTSGDLAGLGVGITYDPQTLEIRLAIAGASRSSRVIGLGGDDGRTVSYMVPARFSAYLNVRGALDWTQQGPDQGLAPPVMFLDGAMRWRGVVFENEANLQPGVAGPDYQRRGSRLVYDDRERLVRWSAGDLQTTTRAFQSTPEILGFSASRRYSVLDPQTIVRPRGRRSFQLSRRSMVEVRINGNLVRRMELEPGSYDLQDFPFAQGANDVELTITDDSGRTERIDFDIFLDQAQLASGLSEFGLHAGFLAPLGLRGPAPSNRPAFSGFYRRGLSDRVTAGGNLQADQDTWMGGTEVVVATPIGAIAGFGSVSRIRERGTGWAGLVNFQRSFARGGIAADAFSLTAEARSRDFAPMGIRDPDNPYSLIVGASYGRALGQAIYAGIDARYSRGRGAEPDLHSLRGTISWSLAPRLGFNGEVNYERDQRGSRFGTLFNLTYRFDRRSTMRADFDSRYDRARMAYQTFGGSGIGSYSLNADVEHSEIGFGSSVNARYFGNRADLGFSHFGLFERDLGRSTGQRSSFQFGTALAFADGVATVGRPIYDAFAVVKAHQSISDNAILIDASGNSASASTGILGSALQPSLSSYADRSLSISAPEAPINLDLGAGSFRLLPPYRGGYLLTVGSDYNISAVGRLLDEDGEPVALVSGSARELAHPDREPIAFFTNRDGRFGLVGLAPGDWVLQTAGGTSLSYTVRIVERDATLTIGDTRPLPADVTLPPSRTETKFHTEPATAVP